MATVLAFNVARIVVEAISGNVDVADFLARLREHGLHKGEKERSRQQCRRNVGFMSHARDMHG